MQTSLSLSFYCLCQLDMTGNKILSIVCKTLSFKNCFSSYFAEQAICILRVNHWEQQVSISLSLFCPCQSGMTGCKFLPTGFHWKIISFPACITRHLLWVWKSFRNNKSVSFIHTMPLLSTPIRHDRLQNLAHRLWSNHQRSLTNF